ncbi:MAG TPA: EamA family transporter, partial [Tenuifilaceae bacterium]|nr:EamA family transporter [Tenuifilaceae bacterium]
MGKISFVYSVLYLGVLSSVVSSFLSNYALKYISTANVSIFNNISPLISIVGGVVFLRETLYLAQI